MKRFARRASTQHISYRVTQGACIDCQFRKQCTPAGQARTISRFFDQNTEQGANQKTGAVLFVGGGIGGVQAALDLAESGYYVYLVEKSPAIGDLTRIEGGLYHFDTVDFYEND